MSAHEHFKSIAAKQQTLERPMLTPHLQFRTIEKDKVLLVSETFNTLLHGQVYADVLAVADGQRNLDEISATLLPVHPQSTVDSALKSLAARGYLIESQFKMELSQAAYWTSIGTTPTEVEQVLGERTVSIEGDDDGRLTDRLHALGAVIDSSQPSLSVYICEDYLDQYVRELNRCHLRAGTSWMLIRPKGMHPMFGPVFQPARDRPCWECLAHRMRNNNEVHSFIRNREGEDAAFRARIAQPLALDSIFGLIALKIAAWLVLGRSAVLHDHVVTFDVSGMNATNHPVMHRPQCASCGDSEQRRPDRKPKAITLQQNPKALQTSGGVRVRSPAETIEQYRHLVSPVSGVVTWVKPAASSTDPWLHVHWAGSNLALRIKNLSSLRRSLRSKSAGKGTTAEQSEVGALCEAVERYSGIFHGDEIRIRKRFVDFEEQLEERAIHPNDVQLFSDNQLDNADRINAQGHFYNIVPHRFDTNREIEWTPVWSLTQRRHCYLPTALLYGMAPEQPDGTRLWADSNGCAAGNTIEEAILQGFLELIERDAFAIWWYNRLHRPGLDLESFNDEYLTETVEYYRKYNREVWLLDLTGDFNIPVFVALSRRNDREVEDIIYGAGAHLDPHIAALRAVCELNQCLTWVPKPGLYSDRYVIDDPMCLKWWKTARLANHSYLAPAENIELRRRSDFRVQANEDLLQDIEWCRSQVEAKGMEFLVLDQTRPDVGMPVVRVIVPGLRHFWERLAPGRLYDVPVELGLREETLGETDMNPDSVIA